MMPAVNASTVEFEPTLRVNTTQPTNVDIALNSRLSRLNFISVILDIAHPIEYPVGPGIPLRPGTVRVSY